MAALASCSQQDQDVSASQWGCAAVTGLAELAGSNTPNIIVIGEQIESNEAPRAVGAIACGLAEQGESVLVALTEHVGGMTDAEARLRNDMRALADRTGAHVRFGMLAQPDEAAAVRNRTASEARQAEAFLGAMAESGATKAVLLVPHSEASLTPYAMQSERFSGFEPMAMHLPADQVASFEVRRSDETGASDIALRHYPARSGGFTGELALAKLTHPELATFVPQPRSANPALQVTGSVVSDALWRRLAKLGAARRKKRCLTRATTHLSATNVTKTSRPCRSSDGMTTLLLAGRPTDRRNTPAKSLRRGSVSESSVLGRSQLDLLVTLSGIPPIN